MRTISLKCPECDAPLNIEEGRSYCYCQYCGTKISINDNSVNYTYRKIDEARIKEAEVREKIRLKELELEMDKRKETKNANRRKFIFSIIKIILSIFLGFIGVISLLLGGSSGGDEIVGTIGLLCFVILIYMWFPK